MEPIPVGKRTRAQRARLEKELRERNKKARLDARSKYRREKEIEFNLVDDANGDEGKNGGECKKEDAIVIVDEEEFNKRFAGLQFSSDAPNMDVGSGEDEFVDYQFGITRDCFGQDEGWLICTNEKESGDGNDSDESLQILGERWNFAGVNCEYDDVDDSDDEDIIIAGSNPSVGRGDGCEDEGDGDGDDNTKDKDFNLDGNYSTSDYTSSSDDFSDKTSTDDEDYGVARPRERKKREGDESEETKERRRELNRMRRKERNSEEEVRDADGNVVRTKGENRPRKGGTKKERMSGENGATREERRAAKKRSKERIFNEVLEKAYDILDPSVKNKKSSDESGGDVGKQTRPSGPKQTVRLKKCSDGVFRKVVCNEDEGASGSGGGGDQEPRQKTARKERVTDDDGDDDEEPRQKTARTEGVTDDDDDGRVRAPVNLDRELTPQAASRRKRKLKSTEVQNSLLDTILEEAELEERLLSPREQIYLPLKFSFPAKKAPEMPEVDELDELFKELEFGLQTCHIGSDALNDGEEGLPPATEISENMRCAGGNHHFIHDEEIGIYCKFCSYVKLESKYVTPDFNDEIFGRAGRSSKLRGEDRDGIRLPDFGEGDLGDPEPSKIVQGTVWELIPGTWSTMYPHQREGFEFIWRNVAGGITIEELDQPGEHGLGGCIICHAPGTGKTRLAIVFIQSFLRQYPMSKPVIVAPRTMLRTWQEEFARWKVDVPFFNLNEDELTGKEDSEVLRHVESFKHRKTIRLAKLSTWVKGKGILGISYGLFEKLANEKRNTDQKIREVLLNRPGLMVLDEGHTPRNDKSNIWRVLSDVTTKKKVILSGTPFQNNFDELSNTLSLVREEFEVPIKSGSYAHDERKIEELSSKIRPFVHVHKGEILKETLRGLFSSLIVLNPSKLQERCFAALAGQKNFALDNLVSVSSVHPSIFCEQKPSFVDKEWAALLESHKEDLDAGVKTRFLVELIQLSQGERVLVFGQFLPPLNFLADLLKSRFNWTTGRELLYMDGHQDTKERQNTIRFFNDPGTEARVLLASTKACCEGIHLVGASRVVLLDVVWNPSVERQAISRAYRLGQKRDVFVYHLITSGTLEEQKYRRQTTKERLSELVFSSSDGKCIQEESTVSEDLVDQVLEAMINHEKLKTMFQKIVYQPKADNLIETFGPLNL